MSSVSSYTESAYSNESTGGVLPGENLSTLRHRKKHAEDDARLLINRISLLEKEEQRAIKKIMLAKSRAEEILEIREEADRKLWEQVEIRKKEREEEATLKKQHEDTERMSREARAKYVNRVITKKREGVAVSKKEAVTRWKTISLEKNEAVVRNKVKRNEIVQVEVEQREIRQKVHEDLLERNKRNYQIRVLREQSEAKERESFVRDLESKEKLLIDKLRDAQRLQHSALSELEYALNGTSPKSAGNGVCRDDGMMNPRQSRSQV